MKIQFDHDWGTVTVHLGDPRRTPVLGIFRVMRAGGEVYRVFPKIRFSGHSVMTEKFWEQIKIAGDTAVKVANVLNGAESFEAGTLAIEREWPDDLLKVSHN